MLRDCERAAEGPLTFEMGVGGKLSERTPGPPEGICRVFQDDLYLDKVRVIVCKSLKRRPIRMIAALTFTRNGVKGMLIRVFEKLPFWCAEYLRCLVAGNDHWKPKCASSPSGDCWGSLSLK